MMTCSNSKMQTDCLFSQHWNVPTHKITLLLFWFKSVKTMLYVVGLRSTLDCVAYIFCKRFQTGERPTLVLSLVPREYCCLFVLKFRSRETGRRRNRAQQPPAGQFSLPQTKNCPADSNKQTLCRTNAFVGGGGWGEPPPWTQSETAAEEWCC